MPIPTRKEPNLTFLSEVPPPPETLREEGKKRWNELAGYMLANGNLAYLFLPTLERACILYDKLAHFEAKYVKMEEHNLLFMKAGKTGISLHAVERACRQHDAQLAHYLEQLGMSPKSRKNGNLPVAGNTNNPNRPRQKDRSVRPNNLDEGLDLPVSVPISSATG